MRSAPDAAETCLFEASRRAAAVARLLRAAERGAFDLSDERVLGALVRLSCASALWASRAVEVAEAEADRGRAA